MSQATPKKRVQQQGIGKQMKRIMLDESEEEVEELKVKDNNELNEDEEEEGRSDIDITAFVKKLQ